MLKLLFVVSLAIYCGCSKITVDRVPMVHGKEMILAGPLGPIEFIVEIADTESKRSKGLSFRKTMPPHAGMLFIFEEAGRHPFWMKNTSIPLDLIFFDDTWKIVGIIENAIPMSLAILTVDENSRYVLEVLAGSVKKFGITKNTHGRIKD